MGGSTARRGAAETPPQRRRTAPRCRREGSSTVCTAARPAPHPAADNACRNAAGGGDGGGAGQTAVTSTAVTSHLGASLCIIWGLAFWGGSGHISCRCANGTAENLRDIGNSAAQSYAAAHHGLQSGGLTLSDLEGLRAVPPRWGECSAAAIIRPSPYAIRRDTHVVRVRCCISTHHGSVLGAARK